MSSGQRAARSGFLAAAFDYSGESVLPLCWVLVLALSCR